MNVGRSFTCMDCLGYIQSSDDSDVKSMFLVVWGGPLRSGEGEWYWGCRKARSTFARMTRVISFEASLLN